MNQDSPPVARLVPVTARGQRARLRLLAAAETVFGSKGYEGASIAEICRQAESALGSFYVYFPDKKAAYVELIDSLGSRLRRELGEATVGIEGRLAIERAGLRAFFDFAARHRQLYRIVRQAEFVDPDAFHRYYRRMATAYTAGIAEAMDAGELRRLDPEVIAYALMGISDFLGMRWVLWSGDRTTARMKALREAEMERVLDDAMSFIRAGLAPSESVNGTHAGNARSKPARVANKRASARFEDDDQRSPPCTWVIGDRAARRTGRSVWPFATTHADWTLPMCKWTKGPMRWAAGCVRPA